MAVSVVVFMIAVCGVALVGFGVLGCLVILRWFGGFLVLLFMCLVWLLFV